MAFIALYWPCALKVAQGTQFGAPWDAADRHRQVVCKLDDMLSCEAPASQRDEFTNDRLRLQLAEPGRARDGFGANMESVGDFSDALAVFDDAARQFGSTGWRQAFFL